MKTNHYNPLHGLTILIVSLLALLAPLTASATPMPGSYMSGVIQSVNPQTRQVVFQRDNGDSHTFVYTTTAHFWQGGQDVSPAALRAGMHVKIRLHHPLIGPEFVRDITLLDAGKSPR